MKRITSTLALGLIVTLGSYAQAGEVRDIAADQDDPGSRAWMKYHQVIADEDGTIVARYTHIRTQDDVQPYMGRILFRTESGVDLVVRNNINSDGSGRTSVTHVGTGETLTFSLADLWVRVTLGDATFEFSEDQEGNDWVRSEGRELLETSSTLFANSLRELAEVGTKHSAQVANIARMLRAVFYGDIAMGGGFVGAERQMTDVETDFSPGRSVPGDFERSFGRAFRE